MLDLFKTVEAFCRTANDVLPEVFSPDCCLNGTRVVIEGLGKFGIRAEPVSVYVVAMNKAYVDFAQELGDLPNYDQLLADPREPWAIGVDTKNTARTEGWPGHLVAVVENRYIVDAAAGQYNRPQRKIHLPNVVMAACPQRFAKRGCLVLPLPEEGRLEYKARKGDKSYEKIAGFQRHAENLGVAARILSQMGA